MYKCEKKEKIQCDYDVGPMVRDGTGESLETDQADIKCQLARESQERAVRAIGSLSTLPLI